VAGKHEPPTRRGFYLNVATSTLRGIILVVLVAVGIIGVTKLFPQNASLGVTGAPSPKPSTIPISPTSTPSTSPTQVRKANVKGVVVLVKNGTGKTGLAASVSQTLSNAGYKVKSPGDASKRTTTLIYYRADSEPEAALVQRRYFQGAQLQPAPASVPPDVQVEIILGTDFLASPSP